MPANLLCCLPEQLLMLYVALKRMDGAPIFGSQQSAMVGVAGFIPAVRYERPVDVDGDLV